MRHYRSEENEKTTGFGGEMKEKIIISRFDASDYLDSEEAITEYLEAIKEENPTLFASAMKDVEKARSRIVTFHDMMQLNSSEFSHA